MKLPLIGIGILIIIFLLDKIFMPAIDHTRDGKILLWYGRKHRKFIVLYKPVD